MTTAIGVSANRQGMVSADAHQPTGQNFCVEYLVEIRNRAGRQPQSAVQLLQKPAQARSASVAIAVGRVAVAVAIAAIGVAVEAAAIEVAAETSGVTVAVEVAAVAIAVEVAGISVAVEISGVGKAVGDTGADRKSVV